MDEECGVTAELQHVVTAPGVAVERAWPVGARVPGGGRCVAARAVSGRVDRTSVPVVSRCFLSEHFAVAAMTRALRPTARWLPCLSAASSLL